MSKMKKEYGFRYIFKGSTSILGSMVCRVCGLKIDNINQDYLVSQQTLPDYDWRYVCRHRECLPEKYANKFNDIEKQEKQKQVEHDNKVKEITAYLKTYIIDGIIDAAIYQTLEDLGILD